MLNFLADEAISIIVVVEPDKELRLYAEPANAVATARQLSKATGGAVRISSAARIWFEFRNGDVVKSRTWSEFYHIPFLGADSYKTFHAWKIMDMNAGPDRTAAEALPSNRSS